MLAIVQVQSDSFKELLRDGSLGSFLHRIGKIKKNKYICEIYEEGI